MIEEKTRDSNECSTLFHLTELPTIGRQYTWTNGHVFSKIDKALVNAEWVNSMVPRQVLVMEPSFSDHSPLSITLHQQRDKFKRPFRFYNCLTQHSCFQEKVRQGWTRHNEGMRGIWNNLKEVRREMQQLNHQEFSGTTQKVQKLREKLEEKQKQLATIPVAQQDLEEEKEIKKELNKWSKIEEAIYKQKSRIQWLKLGDDNTRYFFAAMKSRKAQNQITMLKKKRMGLY